MSVTVEELSAVGAYTVSGSVMLDNVCIGACTIDGIVLTPEGEAALTAAKAPKKRTAKPVAEAPAE